MSVFAIFRPSQQWRCVAIALSPLLSAVGGGRRRHERYACPRRVHTRVKVQVHLSAMEIGIALKEVRRLSCASTAQHQKWPAKRCACCLHFFFHLAQFGHIRTHPLYCIRPSCDLLYARRCLRQCGGGAGKNGDVRPSPRRLFCNSKPKPARPPRYQHVAAIQSNAGVPPPCTAPNSNQYEQGKKAAYRDQCNGIGFHLPVSSLYPLLSLVNAPVYRTSSKCVARSGGGE
mmetsp:Transcript_46158/g.118944  ORF Transcript_46158/g.118944 Transcript_46158/m.118944 type:complete len:230 (-) Transcript_46158:9-698(-)